MLTLRYINLRSLKERIGADLIASVLAPSDFDGTIGIVDIKGDLHEVAGFTSEHAQAAQESDALVVVFEEAWFRENGSPTAQSYQVQDLSKTEYGSLPAIVRLFIKGVEMQLGRAVAYLGWRNLASNEIVWVYKN